MDNKVLSARVSKETMDKLDALVKEFNKDSIGSVSRRAVIEKAVDDLYKKTVEEE